MFVLLVPELSWLVSSSFRWEGIAKGTISTLLEEENVRTVKVSVLGLGRPPWAVSDREKVLSDSP